MSDDLFSRPTNDTINAIVAAILTVKPNFEELTTVVATLTTGIFAKSTFNDGHQGRMAAFDSFAKLVRAEIEKVVREEGEPTGVTKQ